MGKVAKRVAGKIVKKMNIDNPSVDNLNEVMGEGVGIVMETVDDDDPEAEVAGDDDPEGGVCRGNEHLTFYDILTSLCSVLLTDF